MKQQIPLLQESASSADGDVVAPSVPRELLDAVGEQAVAQKDAGTVHALHRMLEERLRPPQEGAQPTAELPNVEGETSTEAAKKTGSRLPMRLVKAALGLAIVALFGWMPLRTLLQSSSVEAIVNSRVVAVRAPIEGDIVAVPSSLLPSGGVVQRDEPLLRIENPRADRSRLDDLQDQLARTEIEQATLDAKISSLTRSYDALVAEVELFTRGRVAQLEARVAELRADIDIATARRELARSAARRAGALSLASTISTAELERFTQEQTISERAVLSAERRLESATVELEAARSGSFLGDSYNDKPSSAQRRDDLRQRLDELTADRDAAVATIARLREEVAAESTRYQSFADVAVSLPVSGRIWEVMTAPGEHVRVGQDLLKILDCSGAVVTANVSESVYNGLRVGQRAEFHPTDGGAVMEGVVANLTGLAEAPANLAIVPSALSREAYRVTVRVPELAAAESCSIGRTGRVVFDKAPADNK